MSEPKDWERRAWHLLADGLAERHEEKIPAERLNSNHIHAAIKLGREMADARAKEIRASLVDDIGGMLMGCLRCTPESVASEKEHLVRLVQMRTTRPPKTREALLEEALRSIPCSCSEAGRSPRVQHAQSCALRIAQEALRLNPS